MGDVEQLIPSMPDAEGNGAHRVARPDYKNDPVILEKLSKTTPEFDKIEDGLRFRVYRFGALEVRTSQEHDGKEVVGMVYVLQELDEPPKNRLDCREKIVKVMEYVRRVEVVSGSWHSFFVVSDTQNFRIVTELLPNGSVSWKEQAKILHHSSRLLRAGVSDVTVEDMRLTSQQTSFTGLSASKRYARHMYSRACAGAGSDLE